MPTNYSVVSRATARYLLTLQSRKMPYFRYTLSITQQNIANHEGFLALSAHQCNTPLAMMYLTQ